MTIDEYITSFPDPHASQLRLLCSVIRKQVPAAVEKFSYGLPTFDYYGNLVHFAAYKKHIGFYPAPSGILAFKEELKGYVTSKGAVQFPADQKLPLVLIRKIVKFRMKENEEKSKAKQADFLAVLSAPAQRALLGKGINNLKKLAACSEKELLQLHGLGPSAIPKLKMVLKKSGLKFRTSIHKTKRKTK